MRAVLFKEFATRVTESPNAVAVACGTEQIGYAALDRASDAVATVLLTEGYGAGSVVGTAMARGVGLIVGILGIWKAGAAMLPIRSRGVDAAGMENRTDADVDLVLDEPLVRAYVALGVRVPLAPVEPGDAAYVRRTYNSDGRSKAVALDHRRIAGRVRVTAEGYRLGAADGLLHLTSGDSHTFFWEVFASLVTGGRFVFDAPRAAQDPVGTIDSVLRHQVTVLRVVPDALRQLVAQPSFGSCTSLRLLFIMGGPVDAELRRRVLAELNVELVCPRG
ncbi:AMP-binding protein [Amycolatopsis sp. H20-H5]|uniref:AMP-binding protein n=1 Tax=Amycolatopsis sp. H20-H5 TaxID=3046309 RepID=UPI002DB6537F|nr:AMP-binding protein [Amycolatopsis sp. H20-H5]MEC3975539.1 AMP-binding protein [Amycolatopsis sp. H20-H5]